MARTYRKNSRQYRKYRGVIYNTYGDKTAKDRSRNFKIWHWRLNSPFYTPDNIMEGGHYYCEVIVSDSENLRRGAPKGWKSMCNRIDRRRYKAALINNEDAFIKSSFDPWDFD